MSGWTSNSYIRVPTNLEAEDVVRSVGAALASIEEFRRLTRIQYRQGDDWIRVY